MCRNPVSSASPEGNMENDRPFEFMDCINIVRSTGRMASGLRRLRDIIAEISDNSLSHHTCQYFLGPHILEYANDFAQWVGGNLGEWALSERLSTLDLFDLKDMDALRHELILTIDRHLALYPQPREVLPGDEFHFAETITIAFPIGVRARNLAEFLAAIRYVDTGCLYYHFYEARVRHGSDDFSSWFEDVLGKRELAAAVRAIDPFMHRNEVVEKEIRQEMEEVMVP
jgi:hypothetical protein